MNKKRSNLQYLTALSFLFCITSSCTVRIISISDSDSVRYGVIKGHTGYPSEIQPYLKVCAVNIKDTTIRFCVPSNGKYKIKVPPGVYYIFAEELDNPDRRSYYTNSVLCGLHVDCGNRSVILKVRIGEDMWKVNNVNPTDWYYKEVLLILDDTIIPIKR